MNGHPPGSHTLSDSTFRKPAIGRSTSGTSVFRALWIGDGALGALALGALALGAVAFGAVALGGCGGGSWTYEVVGTQRDPGAQGEIQVERIEGGNRMVTASLEHMTPPTRLGGRLSTYIMWFRDRRGQATKASVLEYDPDSRSARATATTPMSRFTVFITAERIPSVVGPSENVVFQQAVETE